MQDVENVVVFEVVEECVEFGQQQLVVELLLDEGLLWFVGFGVLEVVGIEVFSEEVVVVEVGLELEVRIELVVQVEVVFCLFELFLLLVVEDLFGLYVEFFVLVQGEVLGEQVWDECVDSWVQVVFEDVGGNEGSVVEVEFWVLENGDVDELFFSDFEDFVDDVSEEELLGDVFKDWFQEVDGIDLVIVVDNVFQVGFD